MIGQTISHYRIVDKLGGGGMGVVYKAEDTRLHRFVALKFLPDEVAKNAQALSRFQREAQAASALNHPNICTIYDIGEENGQAFIAMEFLEGVTLKHLIAGRPVELDTLLELAIEIADALDAAHAKGIIHRDIKPGNIFVTAARARQGAGFRAGQGYVGERQHGRGGSLLASDRKERRPPDQSRIDLGDGGVHVSGAGQGKRAGCAHRSFLLRRGAVRDGDGHAAFSRRDFRAGLQCNSGAQPTPPIRLNPDLPSEMERIISKSLEKDRNLRYQHAAEMRADLQRLKRDTDTSRAVAAASSGSVPVAHESASTPAAQAPASSSSSSPVSAAALASIPSSSSVKVGRGCAGRTAQAMEDCGARGGPAGCDWRRIFLLLSPLPGDDREGFHPAD